VDSLQAGPLLSRVVWGTAEDLTTLPTLSLYYSRFSI